MGDTFARILVIVRCDSDNHAGISGRIGKIHWLAGWARVQWAITLGLIPLLLAMFQQVSLVSPDCQCDRHSVGEPGSRSFNAAGDIAGSRFHAGARTCGTKRLHGCNAVDERCTAGRLEPACATHMGSGSRYGWHRMDAVAWAIRTGIYCRFSGSLAGSGRVVADISGTSTKAGIGGIVAYRAGCRTRDWQ